MSVGNVICLTPPHTWLPGQFDWRRAKLPASAEDSSTDSDAGEPSREKGGCSRPCSRRETSGASMWKPVVVTIALLNIVALGGLVYSAPWTPKVEPQQTSVPILGRQVQRKQLIPLEASVTRDGKLPTRFPRGFLSSAPAAVRRTLLESLREDAADDAGKTAASSAHPRPGAGSPESDAPEVDSSLPLKQ